MFELSGMRFDAWAWVKTYILAMYSGPVRVIIRLSSATNCSSVPESGILKCRWTCASIRCMSSITVDANIGKVDVSFPRPVLGRMRLTNQLRGKVTLCSIPLRELSLYAMMNSPESLSTRSHNGVRSTRGPLRRISLKGTIRSHPVNCISLDIP